MSTIEFSSVRSRRIDGLEDLQIFARELSAFASEPQNRRLIVLLDGPMGAGKTQLTRYLLEALGNHETQSPSFAIHNSYETARGPVEHFDLYRLENEEDLESTGFWDFFRDGEALVLIEWSSRLREMGLEQGLPKTWPKIRLQILPVVGEPTARDLKISQS